MCVWLLLAVAAPFATSACDRQWNRFCRKMHIFFSWFCFAFCAARRVRPVRLPHYALFHWNNYKVSLEITLQWVEYAHVQVRREWTCFSSVFHCTITRTVAAPTFLRHTNSFSFRYWGECGDKRYNKNNNNKFIHKLYVVNSPIGGQHEALNEHSIYTRRLGCYQHTCSFVIIFCGIMKSNVWNSK